MQPYLIQRAQFKDTKNEDITGIDSIVQLDYMGSAEFEFGALPQSLKHNIVPNWKDYIVEKMDLKDIDDENLFFVCHKDQRNEVFEVMTKLFTEQRPYRLKEWSNCYEYIKGELVGRYSNCNFWWDIDNHWICCFGNNINRLILAIRRLHIKYEISKTEPDFGPQFQIVSGTNSLLKGLTWDEDMKVVKIVFNGKESTIVKRNIKDIFVTSSGIDVKVFSKKANAERMINLAIPECTKRDALVSKLKENIR